MKCRIKGCPNESRSRGLCRKHYARWLRHGDPSVIFKASRITHPAGKHESTCSVPGCDGKFYAHGFCYKHYKRWSRHGDPLVVAGQYQIHLNGVAFLENAYSYEGDRCLLWPFAKAGRGYGVIDLDGKRTYVHQLVCRKVHGQRPSRRHRVAHTCGMGHRGCVTPRHLRWSTNTQIAAVKVVHGTAPRAENCGTAKLTWTIVRKIRALYSTGMFKQDQLADRFNTSQGRISAIVNNRTWVEAKLPLASRNRS